MNQQYDEEYDEEYDDDAPANTSWLTNTPYWAISAAFHVIVLSILGTIVILEVKEEKEQRKTIVKKEVKPPKYDPTKKRDIERKPEILEKQKTDPIKMLKPDKISRTPKGTSKNNKTNKNIKNQLNDAFGMTGAGAGAYGNRFGKGSLSREGGSEATESAVLAALYWLKRHQHPDGHWSSNGFLRPDGCEQEQGDGFEGYDVGVTALAMLAFLCAGLGAARIAAATAGGDASAYTLSCIGHEVLSALAATVHLPGSVRLDAMQLAAEGKLRRACAS